MISFKTWKSLIWISNFIYFFVVVVACAFAATLKKPLPDLRSCPFSSHSKSCWKKNGQARRGEFILFISLLVSFKSYKYFGIWPSICSKTHKVDSDLDVEKQTTTFWSGGCTDLVFPLESFHLVCLWVPCPHWTQTPFLSWPSSFCLVNCIIIYLNFKSKVYLNPSYNLYFNVDDPDFEINSMILF